MTLAKRVVYVRIQDQALWDEAKRLGPSVSSVVSEALRQYLAADERKRRALGIGLAVLDAHERGIEVERHGFSTN